MKEISCEIQVPYELALYANEVGMPVEAVVLCACNEFLEKKELHKRILAQYKAEQIKEELRKMQGVMQQKDVVNTCIAGAIMGGRDYDY